MKTLIAEKNYRTSVGLKYEACNSTNLQIEECREPRSLKYLNWIKSIDTQYNLDSQSTGNSFEIFHKEFWGPEINIFPQYVIARCRQGQANDVHVIDLENGCSISHLKKEDKLPYLLQNARILAKNYNYAFVEVYEDKILLIRL